MKILVLSDRVDEYLLTEAGLDKLQEADLILSCGDLPYDYLEYVATVAGAPFLFVLGNHDQPMLRESGRVTLEPEGGTNVHGTVRSVRGPSGEVVLVAGLEGTRLCGVEGYATSELGMLSQVLRMIPRLLWNRVRHGRFLDVLIAHAPPAGIHEGSDPCHRGYRTHRGVIRLFRPALALHGHIHPSYGIDVRPARLGPTRVLSVFGSMVVEVGDA